MPHPRVPMSSTRKYRGTLCLSGSIVLATPLQSTAIFICLKGGQCPLSSPVGAHVANKKIRASRMPLQSKNPGYATEISAWFKFEKGVGASAPFPRPGAPMSPTRKCPSLLCLSGSKLLATHTAVNSHFYMFDGGSVPLVPVGTHVPHKKMPGLRAPL